MSNLLSTQAMVAQCLTRVPIGLSSTFWMNKLNEGYRWICQKGNFIWEQKSADITVNSFVNLFPIPADCDPGKPMTLVGPIAGFVVGHNLPAEVPRLPWDEAANQRYSEMGTTPGMISCWAFKTNFTAGPPPTYAYTGWLFPPDAILEESEFRFYYHTDAASTELTVGATMFFPTPNIFDNLMIDLAEAEARRIYGLAGWEIIQKKAEGSIMSLLDSYRSTKTSLGGLVDQQKQTNEKKLAAQERG